MILLDPTHRCALVLLSVEATGRLARQLLLLSSQCLQTQEAEDVHAPVDDHKHYVLRRGKIAPVIQRLRRVALLPATTVKPQ